MTTTNDDILNSKMNVEVGVALIKPAEFIVFSIQQQMQES
jgi:phage tail sheath protein FI